MKKSISTILVSIMLLTNVSAGTDGENNLSKNPKPVKDCFEGLNRATFSLIMDWIKLFLSQLQKVIEVYRHQLELVQVMHLSIFLLL